MKIKNIGMKPISIDGTSLLPGESCLVDDSYADSVKLFEKLGFVAQEKAQGKKPRGKASKPPDSEAAAETAEEI